MNLKSTPFLILFFVLGTIGIGVAYAVGSVIVEGNMTVTGDLEVQGTITDGDTDVDVIRFEQGDGLIGTIGLHFNNGRTYNANGANDAIIASTVAGIGGQITQLRFEHGMATSVGNTITATVYINGVISNVITCDTTSSNTPESCVWNGSVGVSVGDKIAVRHFANAGANFDVGYVLASVVITLT